MTSLEQLGAFVSQGVRGSVSEPLRAALELRVIDTVAAWSMLKSSRSTTP